ncbi:cysteine hydrolase [Sphingobium sufflavum]|uniref:cysteine hydrolase family protein n=1 Tax=Sphingobium sufflavum TaxID=1129547 RepID=UPI001F289572|nr:cysteine hydrolase [Sphingobium sufflavum]MCE7798021.1 cysteine hydrolase [Sphingobium sufflavum]
MHNVMLPRWAIERGSGANSFGAIDPATTALVVIDMQSAFVAEGEVFGNGHARDIVEPINRLAAAMRDAGATVIWTRQTVSDTPPLAMPPWQYDLSIPLVRRAVETMRPGTSTHGLYPAMAVDPGDLLIDKYRYGAFVCPAGELRAALEARGVEMLVMAGTLTNVCVESTARDGNMLGYKVIVLSDATATVTDEEQAAALLNLRLHFADVRDVAEVVGMLASRPG